VKKDRSRSKAAKDATVTSFGDATNQSRTSRGGRAGFDSGRGGRGRGTDRGRGGRTRGASVAHTNGRNKETAETSIPTPESTAWEAPATGDSWDAPKTGDDSWDTSKPAEVGWGESASSTVKAAADATSSIIPTGVKKSWASMFAAPPPAPKKAPEPVVEKFVASHSLHRYLLTLSLDLQNPLSQKPLSSYLKLNPKFLSLRRPK